MVPRGPEQLSQAERAAQLQSMRVGGRAARRAAAGAIGAEGLVDELRHGLESLSATHLAFLRELAEEGKIVLVHIGTDGNIADIGTKPITARHFHELRAMLVDR